MMKRTYSDESGREIDMTISVEADSIGGGEWSPGLWVFLDEDGDAWVSATSWHSSENGCSMGIWLGRDHEWICRLPQGSLAVPDMDKLVALAEELAPLLIRVREGLSIDWDGSNMRGTFDEDASEAAAEVRMLVGSADWQSDEEETDCQSDQEETDWQSDQWTVWNAEDWLWASRGGVLTAATTDEEIAALAAEYEKDAKNDCVVLEGDISDVLIRWRDELLEEQEAA